MWSVAVECGSLSGVKSSPTGHARPSGLSSANRLQTNLPAEADPGDSPPPLSSGSSHFQANSGWKACVWCTCYGIGPLVTQVRQIEKSANIDLDRILHKVVHFWSTIHWTDEKKMENIIYGSVFSMSQSKKQSSFSDKERKCQFGAVFFK